MVILPYLNIEGPDLQERKMAGSISTIFKPLRYLYVIHSAFMIMYEKLAFVAATNASLTNGSRFFGITLSLGRTLTYH